MKLIAVFLLIASIFASPSNILKAINNKRNDYNLPMVSYDHDLANELDLYKHTYGDKWFVKNTTDFIQPANWTNTPFIYGGKQIFKMGYPRKNYRFILNYATFDHWTRKGFRYMFHDTNNGDIARTLSYRITQNRFFDWSGCNRTYYNYYSSCLKKEPPKEGGHSDSWSFQFTPFMLARSFTKIACVKLDVQGEFAPPIQKKMFVCYFQALPETSDLPFSN